MHMRTYVQVYVYVCMHAHTHIKQYIYDTPTQTNTPTPTPTPTHLEKRVQAASGGVLPKRVEVVGLELLRLPAAVHHHLHRDIGRRLCPHRRVLGPLAHLVRLVLGVGDHLALLELVDVSLGRNLTLRLGCRV